MNSIENHPEIDKELGKLLDLIDSNPMVQMYKNLEKQVKHHKGLQELEEKIKKYQKDAVQFAHYGKPEAEQNALQKVDQLTEEFNQHPLVLEYREVLIEVNDLLQHITYVISEQVNQSLLEDHENKQLEKKEENKNASKD